MRAQLHTCLLAFLLALCAPTVAIEAVDFEDAELRGRYEGLIGELRCLVCQNQSLADSDAQLAQDMREAVKELLEQGGEDEEILAHMTDRYGEFVLLRPVFDLHTAFLWLGPLLFVVLGGFVAWFSHKRSVRGKLTDEQQKRVSKLLS